MAKTIIATPNAPAAIGTYSQAVRVGDTVYLSGQIGLDPASMQMVDGIDAQIVRVFENLKAVAEAAGGHRRRDLRPRQPQLCCAETDPGLGEVAVVRLDQVQQRQQGFALAIGVQKTEGLWHGSAPRGRCR